MLKKSDLTPHTDIAKLPRWCGFNLPDKTNALYDAGWLERVYLKPWILIHKQRMPVMFRHTSNAVTLAWMEDFLKF